MNVKIGYRYPTGYVSAFDDGIDYEKTKSDKIYEPGLALGLNIGYIYCPLISGAGLEGGYLSFTNHH